MAIAVPATETFIPAVFHRKSILSALLALIFLSFFGTLTLSASMSPRSYDWRYSVISHLLSPQDNPSYYRLAAGRVVVARRVFFAPPGCFFPAVGKVRPRGGAGFSRRFFSGRRLVAWFLLVLLP